MSDRRNRRILVVIGLLLAAGGGLSCFLGAGGFGSARSDRAVFDTTVVRWWNEGGWMSFATVVAIGFVAAVTGTVLMAWQLRRNDGRSRVSNFAYPAAADGRGETSVRAAALAHGLEADLERIPDVQKAMVGLFGAYPEVETRAVLDVDDDVDLDTLTGQVERSLSALASTAQLRPAPVQITVRFKAASPPRQLA
ncbi:MAG: hypothetical protein KGQ66_01710 [Acidobacteriota bacterium]|nr:hypothetical protein [Acidobacteriota bacterium]